MTVKLGLQKSDELPVKEGNMAFLLYVYIGTSSCPNINQGCGYHFGFPQGSGNGCGCGCGCAQKLSDGVKGPAPSHLNASRERIESGEAKAVGDHKTTTWGVHFRVDYVLMRGNLTDSQRDLIIDAEGNVQMFRLIE